MTQLALRALLLVPLAAACASDPMGPVDPNGPTFERDVRPLAEVKCQGCHTEGGIAPFALKSYDDFVAHKDEIKIAVANRIMPPWLAKPGCTDYVGDRSLSDDQIAKITGWVTAGAPRGDVAQYAPLQVAPAPALSRVDLSLKSSVAYTPQLIPDDYRCFLVDWTPTTTKYVSGFRANPDQKSIVHHVIAFLIPPSEAAMYQKLDDDEAGPGYTCFGGPGGGGRNALWLGSWAPGGLGNDYAPGTGIQVEPGSKVAIQVHYNTKTAMPVPDQTSVDFRIEDTVQKRSVNMPWTNWQWITGNGMRIPAGQADVMHSFSFDITSVLSIATSGVFQSNQPVTLYGVGFHQHTRGKSGKVEIARAGGTRECMVDIPRWDFNWQGSYGFAAPKVFNPGDKIDLECHWNNADSTIDRTWGEGTDDEMCLTGFYITQ
jgi:hypothetical protein